jgi:Rrf2 family nitric oxide-sensitive transcriptional repressor
LQRRAEDTRPGEILRITEPDFNLVECFSSPGACALERICRLPGYLHEAGKAFLGELDKHSLADITSKPAAMARRT